MKPSSSNDLTTMTKCFAMMMLKLGNNDISSINIQNAVKTRVAAVEVQEKLCLEMLRIHEGSQEEVGLQKKADKLFKEKEKVRSQNSFLLLGIYSTIGCRNVSFKRGVYSI